MLALAVSSGDICVVIYHDIPEVLSGSKIHIQIVFFFLRQFIVVFFIFSKHAVSLYCSCEFRNCGICVFTAEHVLACCQLLEQRHFIKALCRLFDVIVSCNAVQFIESLIHTAVLDPEYLLFIRKICTAVVQILSEVLCNCDSFVLYFRIIYIFCNVNQSCQHFMQIIIWNKYCAVVRCRSGSAVKSGKYALRERGNISCALRICLGICILTFLQSVYSCLNLFHKLCLYIRIVLTQICLRKS